MQNEIERKFLVKELPNLNGLAPIRYERYFLADQNGYEIRIQKKGDAYELERKKSTTNLASTKIKESLTLEEFERLKHLSQGEIIRDSYQLSINPSVSLKIYHGQLEGLARAEVEFESESAAKEFIPHEWMGNDITDTPLGRDGRLVHINEAELKKLIANYSSTPSVL
ncbi:MAG: hypothetical protein AAB870_01515 [Patescibacteria group bacterium]